MALHVSVLKPKFSKVLTFSISTQNIEKVTLFYIVVLKAYHTAIQYLDNITLSLVATPRQHKKLTVHVTVSGCMQIYNL